MSRRTRMRLLLRRHRPHQLAAYRWSFVRFLSGTRTQGRSVCIHCHVNVWMHTDSALLLLAEDCPMCIPRLSFCCCTRRCLLSVCKLLDTWAASTAGPQADTAQQRTASTRVYTCGCRRVFVCAWRPSADIRTKTLYIWIRMVLSSSSVQA